MWHVDFTAESGAYYRVYVDGTETSKHTTQYTAQENAAKQKLLNPDAEVWYQYPDARVVAKTSVIVFPAPLGTATLVGSQADAGYGDVTITLGSSVAVTSDVMTLGDPQLTIATDLDVTHPIAGQEATGTLGTVTPSVQFDVAPSIITTPSPSFTVGISGTYNMTQHVSDDGISPISYSLNPNVSGGLTFNTSTGVLSYDGTGGEVTTSHTLTATDATDSATTGEFSVSVRSDSAQTEFSTHRFQVSGSSGLATETLKNTHFPVLRFTHTPSAETLDLLMYYKGSDIWEVNVGLWLPSGTSAAGTWTWEMISGDAGLQAHVNATGSLNVGSGSHRGALAPHPTLKKWYYPQSGLPAIPFELRSAFFVSDVSTPDFTAACAFMQANGIGGLETQLTQQNAAPNDVTWDGTKNDWIFSDQANTIFHQAYWDRMQERMDTLNAYELVGHVMLYSDDAGAPNILGYTDTQGLEFIPKYAAARLSGYAGLIWNGGIDGSEYYSTAQWNTWATNLIAADPYNHGISNRAGGGVTAITNETYSSHIWPLRSLVEGQDPDLVLQFNASSKAPGFDDAWGINRSSHSAKNHTNDDSYNFMWRVFIVGGGHFLTRIGTEHGGSLANRFYDLSDLQSAVAGVSGSQFANAAKYFKQFVDTYIGVDYLNMDRDNSYTSGDGNHSCAYPGNKVVVLSMRGTFNWDNSATGDVPLNLTAESGTWTVRRYNILTGEMTGLSSLTGGNSRNETPPNSTQSWVYLLEAEAQPTWNNTFANLPAPVQYVPYSVDLTTYGVNVNEVHAISTSRSLNNGESIWPEGLSLDTSTGVLSGTPTGSGDVAVVEVVGVSGTFDQAADWSYRSSLPNMFITQNFPDNASVRSISDNQSGNPARSVWDSNFKLFGNGSLRQETLDSDVYPGDTAGWMYPIIGFGAQTGPPFSDATPLAIGEELWVCYSLYHNRADVDWIPLMPTQQVKHTAKLCLIDEAAGGGAGTEQIAHQFQWGHFTGFQGKGTGRTWQNSVNTACDPTDIKYGSIDLGADPLDGVDPGLPSGSGAGSSWTQCQQDRARYGLLYSWWNGTTNPDDEGVSDPVAPGAVPFGWWYSQMCHIKRNLDGSTLLEWYHAPLGQDWSLIYTTTESGWSYDWRRMQLTNSNGGGASDGIESEAGVRPKYERWYDGIITRKGATRIPAPGFSS